MSKISLVIEKRSADIGGFIVGRILPFRAKRSVGPFVFIDHMGPANLKPNDDFDILPHPHIGLSTLTYLLDGSITHRDSLGSVQDINPGAVNWMTAGKGIVHSERTPEDMRGKARSMHGLQIWVGLPKELEDSEPSFHHVPADDIPQWEVNGMKIKLIAGEALGKESPVPVHSKLYMIKVISSTAGKLDLGAELYGETGIYILSGSISNGTEVYGPNKFLVLDDNDLSEFELAEDTTIFIFGGEPFPEKRLLNWNFVSSSKDKLDKAVEDWKAGRFPEIPNEEGFVPYPDK